MNKKEGSCGILKKKRVLPRLAHDVCVLDQFVNPCSISLFWKTEFCK